MVCHQQNPVSVQVQSPASMQAQIPTYVQIQSPASERARSPASIQANASKSQTDLEKGNTQKVFTRKGQLLHVLTLY